MVTVPDDGPNSKSLPLKFKGGKGKQYSYLNLRVKAVELFGLIRKARFPRPWGKLLLSVPWHPF